MSTIYRRSGSNPLRASAFGGTGGARSTMGGLRTSNDGRRQQYAGASGAVQRSTGFRASEMGLMTSHKPPQSLGGGRTSTAFFGSQRSSSLQGGRSVVGPQQEVRPIQDKNFQNQCIADLIEFCKEHNCPFAIGEQQLRKPSRQDFLRVFEFLYHFMDDKFQLNAKVPKEAETAIPSIFKSLGYPFEIKKSSIQSVTTAWPHLLAALAWLKDLIRYATAVDIANVMFGNFDIALDDGGAKKIFDGGSMKKLFFEFNARCYILFSQGEQGFADQLTFLQDALGDYSKSADEKRTVLAKLQRQLEVLEETEKASDSVFAQRAQLETDAAELQRWFKDIHAYHDQLRMANNNLMDDNARLEEQLATVESDNRKKREIISQQQISSDDVKRLNYTKQQELRDLANLQDKVSKKEKEAENLTMAMATTQQTVNNSWLEFTHKVKFFAPKVLPPTMQFPMDLEHCSPFHPDFMAQCEGIKKGLVLLMNTCSEGVRTAELELLEMQHCIAQLQEDMGQRNGDVERLTAQIEQCEQQAEQLRQAKQRDKEQHEGRQRALQNRLLQLQQTRDMSCAQLAEQRERLIDEKETAKQAVEESADQYSKEYLPLLTQVLLSQDEMKAQAGKLTTAVEQIEGALADKLAFFTPDAI